MKTSNAITAILLMSLLIIFLLSPDKAIAGHKFACEQDLNSISGLKYQTINNDLWSLKYYSKEKDSICIGDYTFSLISYLFWNNKYLGYIVYLNNKDDSFGVRKYFFNLSRHGEKIRDNKFLWQIDGDIIIFEKFSIHQAKITFLCKNAYLKIDPEFKLIR